MILSAPTPGRRLPATEGTLPTAPAGASQVVLMVDLVSPEGGKWWAVGVGDNLTDALAFPRESCPTDTTWRPLEWNDLYGH